jgi:solute carrier family 25 phosphate transporter 23/24/25/41
LKIGPEAAVKFFTYETLKKVLCPEGEEHIRPHHRFLAGGLAAVAAHTSVFPLEVIKTRLSVSGKGTYSSISDAFFKIAKSEGYILPFYRGLAPSLLSTVPSSGTNLTVYESLKKSMSPILNHQSPILNPVCLFLCVSTKQIYMGSNVWFFLCW